MDGSARLFEAAPPPRIGVVVPAFGHPGLLGDALDSLLNQIDAPPFRAVIVNDGCALRETDRVARTFAAAEPHRLGYIRRRNGGLSAARNTGIDALLAEHPSLEAIYFLDADNALEPWALSRMAAGLQRHPEADWLYPDLLMFGLSQAADMSGAYSRLAHADHNMVEAGSVVRRRVFDAGLRFDESMRQGYEDWAFWLSAQAAGFVGAHLPDMGLRYRKRPESMLADSHRDDAEIKRAIRRAHPRVYALRNLLEREAEDAPRYAVLMDDGKVRLCVDPARPSEELPGDAFAAIFWRWLLRADRHHAPPFLAYASRATLDALERAGTLQWAFWDLEQRLRASPTTAMRLATAGSGEWRAEAATTPERADETHLAMISVETAAAVVRADDTRWWTNAVLLGGELQPNVRRVSLPGHDATSGTAMSGLHRFVHDLHHSSWRACLDRNWSWTASGNVDRHLAYRVARSTVDGGVVLPRRPDGRRHVAMICPIVDFGGAEKVAHNLARELRGLSFVPHLVLFQPGSVRLPPDVDGVYESLLWASVDGLSRWDGPEFEGVRLGWWSRNGDTKDVLGLLAGFDVVINAQSADAHGVMAALRRRGVVTVTHQHVVEITSAGRPGGSATLSRAFEHAYDLMLAGSSQLRDQFIGMGVPQEKLLWVRNAPTYAATREASARTVADRAARLNGGAPLRVTFMARLDRQKGLDRVIALIDQTRAEALDVVWRVVGKPVLGDDELIPALRARVQIEPPVYDQDSLDALYAQSDVIVLPSRYEGAPLTVVEAMRSGCLCLVADAGAVDEMIESRVDGFIVPQIDCVAAMTDVLRRLCGDRELRDRVIAAAVERGFAADWRSTSAPVAARLTTLGARNAARLQKA